MPICSNAEGSCCELPSASAVSVNRVCCVTHGGQLDVIDLVDGLFDHRCDKAILRDIWPDDWPDVSDDPCAYERRVRRGIVL